MGDMADMAIDNIFDDLVHYERYKDSDLLTQYEEGLINEYGAPLGNPNVYSTKKKFKLTAQEAFKDLLTQ